MRAVVQRVTEASVTVDGETVGAVGPGLMVLIGVSDTDTDKDLKYITDKVMNLRVFDDENGVMNRSILDIAGEQEGADGNIIVVSQFTLFASYKKGNRPSWLRAATHDISVPLYEAFVQLLSEAIGRPVGHGEFGADMKVSLCNDGPVTILMDTHNKE